MKPASLTLPFSVSQLTLVLSFSLTACGGAAPQPSEPPEVERFPLRAPAASHYDSRATDRLPPRSDAEKLLRETVAKRWRKSAPPLSGDGRLDQAATWVLEVMQEMGNLPPLGAVEQFAHRQGVPEPVPQVQFKELPENALAEEVGAEIERLALAYPYTHHGAALVTVKGMSRLALAFSSRWFRMAPFPRRVAPGDAIRLQGKLTHGLREPVIAITLPDGTTRRQPAGDGTKFDMVIPIEESGTYRVELLATGIHGASVLANFPVFSGAQEESSEILLPVAGEDGTPEDEQSFLLSLFALINQERSGVGLDPVTIDSELSGVADSHCRDMRDNGFVGHTSPSTGAPHERLQNAGIAFSLVMENIGHGSGSVEIHRHIMRSPGHREAVLHPLVTHVGLGVVQTQTGGEPSFLVTELFIRR